MNNCKNCEGQKFHNYYGKIVACADCSDEMTEFGIADYYRTKSEKLQLKVKLLEKKIELLIKIPTNCYDIRTMEIRDKLYKLDLELTGLEKEGE